MHRDDRKIFAIIGAGPKGIAAAVKAKVLQEFGFMVDHVILIEKHCVGAHWTGNFGYTNGEMKLGTPPEKDVVFPIETDVGDDSVNAKIKQRLLHFSWNSFLIHTGRYIDWVDRGRETPRHRLWASYLQWVADQLGPHVTIVQAEVIKIDLTADRQHWELTLQTPQNHYLLEADRLMLTGPGQTQTDFVKKSDSDPLPPSTYDLTSFWKALKDNTFSKTNRLAIIGAGEQAASALFGLSTYSPHLRIDVISPRGFISSRAESFYENQMYSQPDANGWHDLSIADRMDFIKRTDLSVFSLHAINILRDQINHKIIPGRVTCLKHHGQTLSLNLTYNNQHFIRHYDQVILATGFDQITLLKSLLSPIALSMLVKALAAPLSKQSITAKIDRDLSVIGMKPYLHLPMLANLMQGPGFANLSCLGLLSDRVMTSFAYKQTKNSNQRIIYWRHDDEKSYSFC